MFITLLMLQCIQPNTSSAGEFNFEGVGSQIMETSVSRSGLLTYEAAVGFSRDSNFNLQQQVQPGWMLNATAIGNLVNVQMSGSGNSVTVNAMQVNRGNQTANVMVGSSSVQASNSGMNSGTNSTGTTSTAVSASGQGAGAGEIVRYTPTK